MSSAAATSVPAVQVKTVSGPPVPYRLAIGLSAVLLIAASLLYLPIVHHPFANLDDQGYVYENLHVQEGLTWDTIKWALRTFDDNNWHPLTWISHALDCQLFGIDPAGHHAMNIVYHAVDVVVLFWVLLLATGFVGRSFMVAALFAVHPLNVEAVAWAAERKTLLSTLFFLLAIGAYDRYARQPSDGRFRIVALMFALALMAKPQIITLPCVLLLWDYWPLRRMFAGQPDASPEAVPAMEPRGFWFLVKEKIPLFLLCAASALLTMVAQGASHPTTWPYSFWVRIGNCFVAYVRYIGKAFWPSSLSVMYLHPGNSLRFWQAGVCLLLLLAITAVVLKYRQYRYLPVGWFWFLGTMVPTIGFIQVGRQAMADRYAYQSFLGLFILVCWGLADVARRKQLPKAALPVAGAVCLAALSVLTYKQIGVWKDNLTLWQHAAEVTHNNWMAEDMVGGILLNTGHQEEGINHYRIAASLAPDDPAANLAIAVYQQNHGNVQEAIRLYKKAIAAMDDPLEQAKGYQNMGVAYRDMGDHDQAMECFRKSVELREAASKLRAHANQAAEKP
jgi:hypothetical protein